MRPKIIAFYLPQFHPTPDNDKWWGKGYTEWTNVAKAKPLFKGHYQPHIPADLGFYDLRIPEIREQQAELAREAGIDGFCYWSYWFGDGKEELEMPFNEVLNNGKPDFPFMLCWANESWHSKFWNKDGSVDKITLIEQQYLGDEDYIKYFYHRLHAFKDSRYIKAENKPVFMIYDWDIPEIDEFIKKWNELARKEGFDGIYFIAHLKSDISPERISAIFKKGFNAINTVRIWTSEFKNPTSLSSIFKKFKRKYLGLPHVREYKDCINDLFEKEDEKDTIYPTLVPNWDHSPRSGASGVIFHHATPELFEEHCIHVLKGVSKKPDPNFVFIRAWNEWGEGNHMEPDLKYGKGYINALHNTIKFVFPESV